MYEEHFISEVWDRIKNFVQKKKSTYILLEHSILLKLCSSANKKSKFEKSNVSWKLTDVLNPISILERIKSFVTDKTINIVGHNTSYCSLFV